MNTKELWAHWKGDLIRYTKFLFGGGIGLVINLTLTFLFDKYFHIPFIVSYGLVLCLEVVVLFPYHCFITFKRKGEFLHYAIIFLVITALNFGGVSLLTKYISLFQTYPYGAIVISAGFFSMLNYILNRKFVFKIDKVE
ncbi:GtrA family protein [Candidatus Woesearchaeota archaeon]|nr:GtrA family protein [Candidatus Woesearchaeota archaeon]